MPSSKIEVLTHATRRIMHAGFSERKMNRSRSECNVVSRVYVRMFRGIQLGLMNNV